MRKDLDSILGQSDYEDYRGRTTEWIATTFKASMETNEKTQLGEFMDDNTKLSEAFWPEVDARAKSQAAVRSKMAKNMIKKQFKEFHEKRMDGLIKAGVTTGLGLNFYDLRAPVALLYPVNTPFRNSMQRHGRVNAGFGLQPHWMATRNVGSVYGGVSEGNRAAFSTPDNNPYTAAYKGLGVERDVTFEAQWAGEGFADNVGDEHIRGLHSVMLQEEGTILFGNSGAAGTGFKLGTATTPTNTRNTVSTGGFASSTSVSVAVVFLTAMGYPSTAQYGYVAQPTVATGLTPSYQRVNADGSKDTISGGTSAISAMSSVVTCDGTHQTTTVTLSTVPNGTYAYAWYVNTTDASAPALSNAYLYSITTVPTVTITAVATGSQNGVATGLNMDNSFNTLDFDGLLTYAASTPGAYVKNLAGNSLTSQKNGRVTEVENLLLSIYQNFQASVDVIWGSADAIENLSAAIRYNGTSASGFNFYYTRDAQNNLLGGFVVSGYQSQYNTANPKGGMVIPMMIHPMMPAGTLFFDVTYNPYPHSRIPFVRGLDVRRDYYSIEWPVTSRQWTFGTYCDEVLIHYVPWLSAIITNVGTFVGN